MNNTQFPVLQNSKALRYTSFSLLYLAQGIPEAMVFFGIPAWMASQGLPALTVAGFIALMWIPPSCKIFVAPFLDRFMFLPMGRRKPWVVAGQTGLVLSFMAFALIPDPIHHIGLLKIAGMSVMFFTVLQDIATDGMAIELVPDDEQGMANGLMWGAKTVGISAALYIGTVVMEKAGLGISVLSLSVGTFLIMVLLLFIRERPGERLTPWGKGKANPETLGMQVTNFREVFTNLFKSARLKNSLLMCLFFVVMTMSFGMTNTALPLLTIQHIGWSEVDYSAMFSTCTLAGGVIGMLLGGWLIRKLGKKTLLTVGLITYLLLYIGYALAAPFWGNAWVTTTLAGGYRILYTLLSIAAFTIAMSLCWKRVSATQFTLFMGFGNLGNSLGSALLGALVAHFSWSWLIAITGLFAIPALLLISTLGLKQHQQKLLQLEATKTALTGSY